MNKDLLKTALLEQRQEKQVYQSSPSIQRTLRASALPLVDRDWVTIVTGVRRCGKSVFSHQLLASRPYAYVNFDDERLIDLTKDHLGDVYQMLHEVEPGFEHLLFDEIQNIPGWELFVNRLLRKGHRILVTGSNSRLLSRELATHLTGRSVSVELFPFSFEEFLVSKKIQWTHDSFLLPDEAARLRLAFEDYIQIGGFPEIALGGYSQRYLQELYDRLITRDITTRHKIRQVQLLKQVALHSISTLGARQTYQKTAKNLSVKGAMTVRKFVDLLEEAYLLFSVSPFSFKVKEILKLPRKIYPIDLGLWRSITLKSGQDTGAQLETFVFLQLRRSHQEIFYFLDQDCEVDFVIREGREVRQLIQVSHSLQDVSTKKREIKALVHASQKTKCKNILVLTSDESGEEKIEGLTIPIMPAWKWALGVHM